MCPECCFLLCDFFCIELGTILLYTSETWSHYACIVEKVVQANDHHACSQLLHFVPRYLKLPKGETRSKSLSFALNKQIRDDLIDDTIVSGSNFVQSKENLRTH